MSHEIDPELPLSNESWMRHLARRLVLDSSLTDDVVQQTWLASLEGSVHEPKAVRAWLASVIRRLAARTYRDAARREARERRSSREEALPSTLELLERAEVHRRLTDAVLALDEPYRTTVLLRFLEGLSSEEIARRQGLPATTVRTRLRRALDRLRSELDRSGDRARWSLALSALAGTPSLPTALPTSKIALAGALMMKVKTVAAVAASLALLAIAAIQIFPGEPEALVPAVETLAFGTDVESTAAGTPLQVAGEPRPPRAGDRSSKGAERGQTVETPAPLGEVSKSASGVDGRIVLVDSEGALWDDLDGSFRLTTLPRSTDSPLRIDVIDGKFRVPELRSAAFAIGELMLEKRPAFPESDRYEIPSEGPLEVRARLVPRSRLRVVDAVGQQDLDELELLAGVPWWRSRVHPGAYPPSAVFARNAVSPLELPFVDGIRDYWVRAPGFAWGHVQIDHRTGGERILALTHAGEIAVTLNQLDEEAGVLVRLYEAGSTRRGGIMAEVGPVEGEPVILSSLPPGAYDVRAEIGNWWDPPQILAAATVQVAPGARSDVVLTLDAIPHRGMPVALSGTLRIPPSVPQDLALSLHLSPVDRPPSGPKDRIRVSGASMSSTQDAEVKAWSAGTVLPGRWLIKIDPLQIAHVVDVGPDGRDDVELEIPELGSVSVRLVDAGTKKELTPEHIAWGRPAPEAAGMWIMENAELHPETRRYEILAPVGRISLFASVPRYRAVTQGIAVERLHNEATIELEPAHGIIVTLKDGESVVPHDYSMKIRLLPIDGEGEAEPVKEDGPKVLLVVERAGLYRLEIEGFEGFEPVPPTQVLVEDGKMRPLSIDLIRVR